MVFIIPREWWGARPPRATFKIKTPTPELWLHHAAGAMLPGDDQVSPIDYQRIRAIQNFHMDVRGWNDIAYSWLVDTDGYVFEGRGPGIAGGHTAGHNTVSHAICVMGNYDIQPVDSDLLPRIAELVKHTHAEGWTPKVFTGGHRDVGATSCPGNKLYPLIPEINRLALEEDDMTPDQEAKLDAVLAAVGAVPDLSSKAVWRTLITTGDYTRSALQSLFRTEQATQRIEAGQDNLDEAELAAMILAGLPADAIADAIEAGPLVDAVRDELNRRFDA